MKQRNAERASGFRLKPTAYSLQAILCWLLITVVAGCATPAERRFAAADTAAIAMYVQYAQPAVEAYCDGADTPTGEQLRIDTRALAEEIRLNAVARLDSLRIADEAIAAARSALDMTKFILTELRKQQEIYHGRETTTAPADTDDQ